jgi:uncharacterized membrane protein
VVVLAVVGAAVAWFLLPQDIGRFTSVDSSNEIVRIAKSDVAGGDARFYEYAGADGPIKFFVVKSSDGIYRAAFDTCDVCYKAKKGYRQEGDYMVCNNCDQAFKTSMVNAVKGGCNPAPLHRVENKDHIVIRTADLETGNRYFNFR